MSNEAVVSQGRPVGRGREITPLVLEDILTRPLLVPEHGMVTVFLWARSIAAYLKSRQLEEVEAIPLQPAWAPSVAKGLAEDFEARTKLGEAKYGERLRAFNGRDALVDAYQESLDLWQYLRQHLEETEVAK